MGTEREGRLLRANMHPVAWDNRVSERSFPGHASGS